MTTLQQAAERVMDAAGHTANRGSVHVFLGSPWSDACDKTVAEPGGAFSPGVWTCGITVWVEENGRLTTPDLLDAGQIDCRFGSARQPGPPVLVSRWDAGPLRVTTELATLGGHGSEAADFLRVRLAADGAPDGAGPVRVHLLVRGHGPAGGRLRDARWPGDGHLTLDGDRRVTPEPAPSAVTVRTRPDGETAAVITWEAAPGAGPWSCGAVVEHAFTDRPGGGLLPLERPHAATGVADGLAAAVSGWATGLPARVFAPDPAVAAAWEASAHHLLAQSECGIPRIGAVDYPVLWMRDTVVAVHALDLVGRHDLARAACDHLAPHVFSGGFGAESDAPGQGIWVLVEHAARTGDTAWLERRYDAVRERAEWLERMRTAAEPLRAVGHNRMPRYLGSPALNVVCLPAAEGLVRGRMDWHAPDLYINCWAYAGFRRAAEAATLLGRRDDAARWSRAADELDAAIAEHLLPHYGNERDPAVAPYPTGALAGHREALRGHFARWYRRHRLTVSGGRRRERLWTYFEAAQAHNALRLDLVEEAWATLTPMLRDGGPWPLAAYGEGEPAGFESLPFGTPPGRDGWLDPSRTASGNMPHVWTAAELIGALRDAFVRDDGPGLVLAPAVPAAWQVPGARFGVRDLPTRFGPVGYTATTGADGRTVIEADAPVPWRSPLTENHR